MGHSTHRYGLHVDYRYININGIGINDYSLADKQRNAVFIKALKRHGFTDFIAHNACIEGTHHYKKHKDHIHAGYQ